MSLAGFYAGPPSIYPGRIGIWSFCEGRKTGELEEKSSEQGENQQQTQPTYTWHGIEPWSYRWEVRAQTPEPSLLND